MAPGIPPATAMPRALNLACAALLLFPPVEALAQTVGRSVIQHDVTAALGAASKPASPAGREAGLDYSTGPWLEQLLELWSGLPREARNQRRLGFVTLLASSDRLEAAQAVAEESPNPAERLEAYEAILTALLSRQQWDQAGDFAQSRSAEFGAARSAGKLELLAAWTRDALARTGRLEACAALQDQLARDFGPRLLEPLPDFERRYLFALEAALSGRRPEAERAWYDLRREGLSGLRAHALSKRLCLAAVRAGDSAAARSHQAAMLSLPPAGDDAHSLEIELGLLRFDLADGDEVRALERAREVLLRLRSPEGLLAAGLAAAATGRLDLAEECLKSLESAGQESARRQLELVVLAGLLDAGNAQEALARAAAPGRWDRSSALALARMLAERGHGEQARTLAGTDAALAQAIELALAMVRGARGDSSARAEALSRADQDMDAGSLFPRIELLEAYDQIGAGHEGSLELERLLRVAAGRLDSDPQDVERVLRLDLARTSGFGLRRLLPTLGDRTQRFDLCQRAAQLCSRGAALAP